MSVVRTEWAEQLIAGAEAAEARIQRLFANMTDETSGPIVIPTMDREGA